MLYSHVAHAKEDIFRRTMHTLSFIIIGSTFWKLRGGGRIPPVGRKWSNYLIYDKVSHRQKCDSSNNYDSNFVLLKLVQNPRTCLITWNGKKKFSKCLGFWISEIIKRKKHANYLWFFTWQRIFESKIPINISHNVVTLRQNLTELEPDGTLILFEGVEADESVDLLEPWRQASRWPKSVYVLPQSCPVWHSSSHCSIQHS